MAKQLGLLKLHQSNTKSEQPYATLLEALANSLILKLQAKDGDNTASISSSPVHTTPAPHPTGLASGRPTASTPRAAAFVAPTTSTAFAASAPAALTAAPSAKAAFTVAATAKPISPTPVSSSALTSTAFSPASLAIMSRMKHMPPPLTTSKPQPAEEEKQQPPASGARRVQRAEESDELLMEEFDDGEPASKTTGNARITAARSLSTSSTARNILTPARSASASTNALFPPPPPSAPTPISLNDAQTLRNLTFGAASATNAQQFSQSWKQQGFYFTQHAALPFGLVQRDGGPCGLIAAVQAEVLRELLWGDWRTVRGVREVSEADQQRALVHALSAMLWRAGGGKQARLVTEGGKNSGSGGGVKGYKPDGITECLLVHTASSYTSLCSLVYQHLSLYLHPHSHGLLLTLYSLCLSRGLPQLASDYDYDGCVLIGQHSYCTQELVNLAITGTAVSNVFDGHKSMDGMVMKGVQADGGSTATVGLLSLFEHYGYVEVGSVLKRPRYPVWIVCSESHYSVLYCEADHKQAAADGWVKFDLFYYDELIKQQEVIRLTVDCSVTSSDAPRSKDLEPPLNDCIRTRWGKHARVSWNGTEPIL